MVLLTLETLSLLLALLAATGASATGLEDVWVAVIHPLHAAGIAKCPRPRGSRTPEWHVLVAALTALLTAVHLVVASVVAIFVGLCWSRL